MLMRHNDHGFHNASGIEIEELKKNGWIESSYEEVKKIIDAKTPQNKTEADIIDTQDAPEKGKPGRKPKNLMGGIYEYNSNKD